MTKPLHTLMSVQGLYSSLQTKRCEAVFDKLDGGSIRNRRCCFPLFSEEIFGDVYNVFCAQAELL